MIKNAPLLYCHNKFKKSLANIKERDLIKKSFVELEREIQKLNPLMQIDLYSATTQFLDSMINEPQDTLNPLEVFHLRCQSILSSNFNAYHKIILGLTAVAISLAAVVLGITAGVCIGVYLGLWQTPLIFMAALTAAELPALLVVSAGTLIGVGASVVSGMMLFKEPKVSLEVRNCIDAVKQSYLMDEPEEEVPNLQNLGN